jgi:hypothetical protein
VPPTVFLGERTVDATAWTERDSVYAMALEDYEASICSGCGQPLVESTDKANEGRYVAKDRICFGCVELDIAGKRFEDHDHPAALRMSVTLPPRNPA